MRGLGCGDLGVRCSFIAMGKTPELVKKELFDHALRRHSELLPKRSEIVERMDSMLACQALPEAIDTKRHVCEDACIRQCWPFAPADRRPGSEFDL